jgi:hypothetical protein
MPLLTVLFGFMPTCLVVASTISLLIIAKKVAHRGKERMKWQGIMTTVLTATVYCVSLMPYIVYRIGESVVKVEDMSKSFFYTHFFRIVTTFISLNTISNFYIYSLTVHSFRSFVLSRVKQPKKLICKKKTASNKGEIIKLRPSILTSIILDHKQSCDLR